MNINKIYEESVKLPAEYFSKYELLPPLSGEDVGVPVVEFRFSEDVVYT